MTPCSAFQTHRDQTGLGPPRPQEALSLKFSWHYPYSSSQGLELGACASLRLLLHAVAMKLCNLIGHAPMAPVGIAPVEALCDGPTPMVLLTIALIATLALCEPL